MNILIFVVGYVLVALGIAIVYLRIGKINLFGVTETRPGRGGLCYYEHHCDDYYTAITMTSILWPIFIPVNVIAFAFGNLTHMISYMAKFVEKD